MIYGNYTYNSTVFCSESTLGDTQQNQEESKIKMLNFLHKKSAENTNLLYRDNHQSKIPLISHHIWLTNPSNPREVKLKDLNNLNNTISILDSQSTNKWQHIFWTNCKTCIPQTLAFLSKINIHVKQLSHYQNDLTSYQMVNDLVVEDNALGMAADIIREDIVINYGGLYLDLNYEINRSPENLMERFNFFVDGRIENYMFAASSQEPILKLIYNNTLNKIKSLSLVGEKIQGCSITRLTDEVTYGIFASTIAENIISLNRTFVVINNHETEAISEISFEDMFEGKGNGTICIERRTKDDPRIDVKAYPTCDIYEHTIGLYQKLMGNFPWQCHELLPFGGDGKDARSWEMSEIKIMHETEYEYSYSVGRAYIQKCLKDVNSQFNNEAKIDLVPPLPTCQSWEANFNYHG